MLSEKYAGSNSAQNRIFCWQSDNTLKLGKNTLIERNSSAEIVIMPIYSSGGILLMLEFDSGKEFPAMKVISKHANATFGCR